MRKLLIKSLISNIVFIGLLFPSVFSSSISHNSYEGYVDNIYGEYLISRTKKRVSMNLEEVPLVDLLKVFSQQTGLNFISTEAVKERKITLYLEDTPVKEAMDIIFKANNLSYDYYPRANIFVVKEMGKPTIELKTKVYKLKYLRVANSRLDKEISSILGAEGGKGRGGEGRGGEGGGGGIKGVVEKVLTENGKVVEEPQTNSLIVIDVPSQFPIIDEVIKSLDVPQPKVLIEVEMLDVAKNLVDKLGVNFAQGLYGVYTGGLRTTAFPFPHRLAGESKGVLTLGTLSLKEFTAAIQFLTQDKRTKFIARPKLLTLSNETAEVNLTTNEAIGLTTTSTEQLTTQNVEREETGTKLRVTPQVDPLNKEITLAVEVVSKEAKESSLAITGLQGKLKDPEERGTKSVVRLKDGETLLLGGLIKNDTRVTVTKVPFLGDIPLLGALFRSKDKDKDEERELLIFITPRIIEDDMEMAGVYYKKSTTPESIFKSKEETMLSSREKAIKSALDTFSKQ